MDATNISVQFQLTIEDLVAYTFYYLEYSGNWKRTQQFIRFVFPPFSLICIILGCVLLFAAKISIIGFPALLIGIGGLIYSLVLPKLVRNRIKANVIQTNSKSPNASLVRQKLEISLNGIYKSTEFGDSTTNWKAIENVTKTKEYLFIQIHSSGAYVIPKKAFQNDSTFDQFAHDVKVIFEDARKIG